jgi:hypothetical protein
MKLFIVLGALTASALPSVSSGNTRPWPQEIKNSAVSACRESIWYHTEQNFIIKRKITRDKLPPDFREKLAKIIEPYLAICDCSIDRLSKEWDSDYFLSHENEVAAKLDQFKNAGICLPQVPAQSNTSSESQNRLRR